MYLLYVGLFLINLIIVCNGGCPTSLIFTFVQNSSVVNTMTINGTYYLPVDATNSANVLSGAYVLMICNSGYVLTGGQLNITCIGNAWTTFPTCALNTGSGAVTTTTKSTSIGLPCVVDITTTYTVINGYPLSTSLSYLSTTAATGSIQFACLAGYVLDPSIGASYICNNGQWSTKPRCLITGRCSFTLLRNFTTSATNIQTTGQSSLMQLPTETDLVLNGSYIIFSCISGYVNNGGSLNVTCNTNSSWSQFPSCVSNTGSGAVTTTTVSTMTGQCSFLLLRNFITSATGIQTTGQNSLMQQPAGSDFILSGSYIVFSCVSGYVNNGGSLNVTCNANSSWSQFPNCVSNTSSGAVTTTTMSTSNGVPCVVDITTTYNITNGYPSSMALSYLSTTTATGSIQFACIPGYVLDPTVGAAYVCNNGQWSTKPRCLLTGRCSFSILRNFTTSATNIQTTGQSSLMQLPSETDLVLNGSYIVFSCISGYINNGGSLNVTCNANSSWSQFPSCVSNTSSGAVITTTVSTMTGQCSFLLLRNFITSATGIQTTGQSSLMQQPAGSDFILSGSYIAFSCVSGYVNNGGSLNVTCNANSSWSQFPNCVSNTNSGAVTTTTMSTSIGLPCVVNITTTYNITNGYPSSMALSYLSTTTATGSIQFACIPGYVLDPSVGASYVCNNGQWSTKPRCLITGRCSFLLLRNFTTSAINIQTTGQSSLMQLPTETDLVLNGSYIVFSCISGYINNGGNLNVTCNTNSSWSLFPSCVSNTGSGAVITTTVSTMTGQCSFLLLRNFITSASNIQTTGQSSLMQQPAGTDFILSGSYIVFSCVSGYINSGGNLNVTCNTNSSWSQFPNCVSNTSSGAVTTTTMSTSNGLPCVVDITTTYNIINGYPLSTSLSYLSTTAATGSIQFACLAGYVLDPSIGASYVCNNGQWSTKPQCLITGRCSFTLLRNFTTSAINIQTTGQSSLVQVSQGADLLLNGSYIVFSCISGYINNGGSLNVTCNTNSSWSQFPNCVLSTQPTTMSSNGGTGQSGLTTMQSSSNCANVPSVANAYVSSATSIQYTNNVYGRQVVFTCNPGYIYVTTSGQLSVSCKNGVWDPLPACTVSPTCSITDLQSGLPVGMAIVSKSLYAASGSNTGILAGSWIQIVCSGSYKYNSLSGPLNITCQLTGKWTTFPVCYL